MCGIIGYNGKEKKALQVLIHGLKILEYRGYDSAGVAVINNNKLHITKTIGKIKNLEEKINFKDETDIGIGHTRWATHGNVSVLNSHPHNIGDITIVHNGIIENYKEIKKELINSGYKFKSNTDTEVACALIDHYYKNTKNIKISLSNFMDKVRGSYALGILVNNEKTIYCIRKDSPLIIAKGENGNFLASDIIAISNYSNEVLYLQEGIIGEIKEKKINLYDKDLNEITPIFEKVNMSSNDIEKCGYDHYMLKEIHEQSRVFKDTTHDYIINGVESLISKMPNFDKYNRFDIVGCGSAYHAGLVGKTMIEKYANIPVNVEIASEYRYKNNFYNKKTLVILISQSGETADTLAVLRKAKKDGIDTLAIINAENSTMAREAKMVLNIKAGKEIAVATTKAYSAQITMLSLIALNLAYKNNNLSNKEVNKILEEIKELPIKIENTISNCNYKNIAKKISKHNNIFFIGRGIDYALCMEGSLKLKEISYIPSQAYQAGELKHGTISLIEKGTPVISILTDDYLKEKTISNIEEVKSRGAFAITLSNDEINNDFDYNITVFKTHELFQPLIAIIPLQLIAYEVAKLKNCDIDKPKNLAKSVTVE